jgi:hypothetical protein
MNPAEGDSAILEKDAQDGTTSITGPLTEDEAAQALLERATKAADRPADDTANEGEPDPKATDKVKEGDTADEDDEDDEKPEPKRKASDDDEIEIKVGDEVKVVPVAALKRLYGQEAALTKKSMELAARREEAEAAFSIANGTYVTQLEKAKGEVDKYAKYDFELLAQRLSPEQFKRLQADRNAANDHFKFLAEEARGFAEQVTVQRNEMQRKAAVEAVAVLKRDIEGWNTEVYKDVRSFAIENGIDEDDFDQLTSAPAIKLMHRAMSATRELETLKARTAKLKEKLAKAPRNAVSSGAEGEGGDGPRDKAAFERLNQTGSTEDAAAVLMARARAARDARQSGA